jgi:hypothetical protein
VDLAAGGEVQGQRVIAVLVQHVAQRQQASRVVRRRVVGDVAGEVDPPLAVRLRGRGRVFRGAPL